MKCIFISTPDAKTPAPAWLLEIEYNNDQPGVLEHVNAILGSLSSSGDTADLVEPSCKLSPSTTLDSEDDIGVRVEHSHEQIGNQGYESTSRIIAPTLSVAGEDSRGTRNFGEQHDECEIPTSTHVEVVNEDRLIDDASVNHSVIGLSPVGEEAPLQLPGPESLGPYESFIYETRTSTSRMTITFGHRARPWSEHSASQGWKIATVEEWSDKPTFEHIEYAQIPDPADSLSLTAPEESATPKQIHEDRRNLSLSDFSDISDRGFRVRGNSQWWAEAMAKPTEDTFDQWEATLLWIFSKAYGI